MLLVRAQTERARQRLTEKRLGPGLLTFVVRTNRIRNVIHQQIRLDTGAAYRLRTEWTR